MEYTTNGFNIPKIKKLAVSLYAISIIGLVLWLVARIAVPGLLPVSYLLNLVGIVLWVVLWYELKKSVPSIVTHAVFAMLLGIIGILGFLFILIATSQANTVIKHNGNVKVTFWNISPL